LGRKLFAEQDNAWHQAAIWDSIFTANHVVEFYLCFLFYTIMGSASWFYARTCLPLFAKGISLPLTLAVLGSFIIFVAVGFNEWGIHFGFARSCSVPICTTLSSLEFGSRLRWEEFFPNALFV
jgi:hypothetical protein